MKTANLLILTGLLLALPLCLTAADDPAVQLTGVRIVGAGHGLNGSELRAFNQQSGTALALLVRAPGEKKIVEVDDDKCSLMGFTDDLGANLLDGVDWDSFPDISEDGSLALIEVKSRNRPSKGASRLSAKGTVHLRVAASQTSEKIDHLKLEVGAKAEVGKEPVEVMKVALESGSLILVLQYNRSLVENMKEVRFFAPDGNEVEIWGRGSFSFGNVAQMEYNLETDVIPDYLTVEIDLWQELEELNIPFDIESGVGF